MKKIFILAIAFCSTLLVSNAQIYLLQEGFENGIPASWGNFDVDDDGHSWIVLDWEEDGYNPHSGNACVTSASYDVDDDELTPNNYLITPAISIPSELDIDNNVALRWWAAAQDVNFPADHYEIYISTTGNTVSDFTSPAVFMETLYTDVWIQQSLNLTPYIGQTIYIAFVHNNCEDEFVMKLDDIEVSYFTEPTIVVGANEVDFGNVLIGEQSREQQIPIISALLSEGLTLSVEPPFEISPCGASYSQHFSVPANTATTIYVRYSPVTAGNDVGSVNIVSGDIALSVSLHGFGVDCSVQEIPFYEDFESDVNQCWTNSDFDEDGMSWMWMNDGYGHQSDGYYVSMSYDTEEWVDIMPNDWLITPQLAIPANGAHLNWWVAAYAGDWPDNTYDVLISTEGTGPGDLYSIYSETTTTEEYQQRTLDLGAYANQNIYIAFAHHTNTEQTADSYGLVIDDISVEAGVGIEENRGEEQLSLYPNPTSEVLNVSPVNGCEILIFNMLGQTVSQFKAVDDSIQIDTRNFAPGTYFVQVKGEKNCVKRFVVKR